MCAQLVHGRSRVTIDPRTPTIPGRGGGGGGRGRLERSRFLHAITV